MVNTPHVQELIKKGDVLAAPRKRCAPAASAACSHFDTAVPALSAGSHYLQDAFYADSRTNLEAKINFG